MPKRTNTQLVATVALIGIGFFLWAEGSGLTWILVARAPGVVTSSIITPEDSAEGGGEEYDVLNVHVAYAVGGRDYRLRNSWTDAYWVSNGRFGELAQKLSQGKPIDVLYFRFAPGIARPAVPVSWGILIAVAIGATLLSVYLMIRRSSRRQESM
jgi:hypothetical protein